MNRTGDSYRIVAEPGEPLARLIGQFAQLRGMSNRRCSSETSSWPEPERLIAMNAQVFAGLGIAKRNELKSQVEAGRTLYIRGSKPGATCKLDPFGPGSFELSTTTNASSYRFTNDILVPNAIRNEAGSLSLETPGAQRYHPMLRPLLYARYSNDERPIIMAMQCGAGTILFDLTPCPPAINEPILHRLADPSKRAANIGALIAVDTARGRDNTIASAFDLVMDDRPANFDYFGIGRLQNFLDHANSLSPGVHIDFAWTPNQTHISRRYLSVLQTFNTGFVWHGFLRHVDHNQIEDLDGEIAAGRALVNTLTKKYGVVFQNVMVFPYEATNTNILARAGREGFLATMERADSRPDLDDALPIHLSYSTAAHTLGDEYVPIIRRYAPAMLSRGVMLAIATLGYPLIATAHPRDAALRRFKYLNSNGVSFRLFDHVFAFAGEKKLRPLSLEQIAVELQQNNNLWKAPLNSNESSGVSAFPLSAYL
ncbi:MAG: hypothetical protein IVW54_12740 [Candidatus Binataceae bacterium]|nr:hypothetical protein [Candidatus Binataceae bacterium]